MQEGARGIRLEIAGYDRVMEVETRAPRAVHRLAPGERCEVAPKTAHTVRGQAGGPCKFLLMQGVGVYDNIAVG